MVLRIEKQISFSAGEQLMMGMSALTKKPYSRIAIPFLAVFIFLLAVPEPSDACTLWAATGGRVNKGGTLMAKNRDNSSGFSTELRFVSRGKGFRFIALFDPEADGYVVSGINEKGLAVTNASAASLPPEKRNVAKEDLTERILTSFSSVDAAAKERAMFAGSHPAFYMIADAGKIAMIEVAPGGKISIKVTDSGVLTHTNHYRDNKLLEANERPTGGSRKRLERINHLLGAVRKSFSFDRFIAITDDSTREGGESIRQPCVPTRNVCTLASWVVLLPEEGSPELYIKIEGKDHTEAVKRMSLDALFWEEAFKAVNP
jgi:isopenicillin-N N-acyltransferase like protein